MGESSSIRHPFSGRAQSRREVQKRGRLRRGQIVECINQNLQMLREVVLVFFEEVFDFVDLGWVVRRRWRCWRCRGFRVPAGGFFVRWRFRGKIGICGGQRSGEGRGVGCEHGACAGDFGIDLRASQLDFGTKNVVSRRIPLAASNSSACIP